MPFHPTIRGATSSYWEVRDRDGGGYYPAESLYVAAMREVVARNTRIQYQPDTGRILIGEDMSDGRPDCRYILYSPGAHGGYERRYLFPGYDKDRPDRLYWRPAEIRLLPGDRAEILGRVLKVEAIPSSTRPFSVGG